MPSKTKKNSSVTTRVPSARPTAGRSKSKAHAKGAASVSRRERSTEQPTGEICESLVFCRVDQGLVDFMRAYARGRKIIDLGAGQCQLEKAMGDQVVSIDLMPWEGTSAICMDARDFKMNGKMLPVFLRPCHSSWVREVAAKEFDNVESMLYIGLPRNLRKDLDLHDRKYAVNWIRTSWRGAEGERIWQIVPREYMTDDSLYLYALMRKNWYEVKHARREHRFFNFAGGFFPGRLSEATKVVQAHGFADLDWKGTILDDPQERAGWLSREGRFYGCAPFLHNTSALYAIGKESMKLDDEGWVHIYRPPREVEDEIRPSFICLKSLSPEQRNWLSRRGYRLEDWQ